MGSLWQSRVIYGRLSQSMGSFGPSTPTYSKSTAVLGSQGESIESPQQHR